jgi:hypothetical protein
LKPTIGTSRGETPLKKKNIAIGAAVTIFVAGLLATLFASGALVSSKTVPSSGIIATANLGVYSDSACTQSLTSIDWGTISPGGSATRTIYVKNLGTAEVTLSLTKTNWNPASANGPITLTWNRGGTVLTASQVATATLTLGVSSSISGITAFSVNIVITGTG